MCDWAIGWVGVGVVWCGGSGRATTVGYQWRQLPATRGRRWEGLRCAVPGCGFGPQYGLASSSFATATERWAVETNNH